MIVHEQEKCLQALWPGDFLNMTIDLSVPDQFSVLRTIVILPTGSSTVTYGVEQVRLIGNILFYPIHFHPLPLLLPLPLFPWSPIAGCADHYDLILKFIFIFGACGPDRT